MKPHTRAETSVPPCKDMMKLDPGPEAGNENFEVLSHLKLPTAEFVICDVTWKK
jgi:hypothetical protein